MSGGVPAVDWQGDAYRRFVEWTEIPLLLLAGLRLFPNQSLMASLGWLRPVVERS